MATLTAVSVEEYLRTSYEPDHEYLDGELVERNVGTTKHSHLQVLLSAYLAKRRKAWGVTVLSEVRTRVGKSRYRLPDLCIVRGPLPAEDVLTSPPWIWIEILSPEDRVLRVIEKVREILEFGCEWVWVIDPETLESRVYTKDSDYAPADGVFRIPGTEVVVPLGALEED